MWLHFSVEDVATHAAAIEFFAAYANNVPKLRKYFLSPSGVPCLEKNIHYATNKLLEADAFTMVFCCKALASGKGKFYL